MVAPHGVNFLFIQACIAILLIVGFESVTAMGAEAKNPTKDIGRAVLLSLAIQAGFCYMFEYFGANFFMNNGYTIGNAGASSAPIGDMMTLVGAWMFGSATAGTYVHVGLRLPPCSWRSSAPRSPASTPAPA